MWLLSKLKGSHGQQMCPRRKREKGLFGKRMRLVSFHLAIARSPARSFLLAAGNCLECALRRTTKKHIDFVSFSKGIKTATYIFDPDSTEQL